LIPYISLYHNETGSMEFERAKAAPSKFSATPSWLQGHHPLIKDCGLNLAKIYRTKFLEQTASSIGVLNVATRSTCSRATTKQVLKAINRTQKKINAGSRAERTVEG
jgi:hypothetical protein